MGRWSGCSSDTDFKTVFIGTIAAGMCFSKFKDRAWLIMKYDDASWHSRGDFPSGSPEAYGGTHIALFLKWCFMKGWIGEFHREENPEDVDAVLTGAMSATDFFFKNCDGKLTDEDFNDEGNRFAARYYGKNGLYLSDYEGLFSDIFYLRGEAEHDFSALSELMEQRLRSNILEKA